MFSVKVLSDEDFDFAVAITESAGWSLKREDFEFSLKLEPQGCFVLLRDSERIGLVTNVSYGGKIAWLGNLIVDEKYRGEGGGRKLVEASLSFMHNKGVKTVGLYAYLGVVSFYQWLGFKTDSDFSVMKGKISSHSAKDGVRMARASDLKNIIDFDRQCFGVSREKLLEPIIRDSDNICCVSFKGEDMLGYAVAKVYDGMAELGPLVSVRDRDEVVTGLVKMIADEAGSVEMLAVVPSGQTSSLELLVGLGFREDIHVRRMFHGPGKVDGCVCFAESLERG